MVIDLTSSPSFEDIAVLDFFETSGNHLLPGDAAAGVTHHVAPSSSESTGPTMDVSSARPAKRN
ncbi:MAG TPA: hypothetical protein VE152_04745 [Acidimicrobiales bacterium]|nr:hypothetical protein [Acidimicrobiales bacterium]